MCLCRSSMYVCLCALRLPLNLASHCWKLQQWRHSLAASDIILVTCKQCKCVCVLNNCTKKQFRIGVTSFESHQAIKMLVQHLNTDVHLNLDENTLILFSCVQHFAFCISGWKAKGCSLLTTFLLMLHYILLLLV